MAHSGLADALGLAWFYGYDIGEQPLDRGLAMAQRAVELAPELTESHTVLAGILMWLRDGPGAERAFARALALRGNYARARHWYALLLNLAGRYEEAGEHMALSLELDPLAPAIQNTAGGVAWARDDGRTALRHFARGLDLEPDYALARLRFGWIRTSTGSEGDIAELEGARSDFSSAGDSIFGALPLVAAAHAIIGPADSARVLLDQAERQGAEPFFVGLTYAALGEPDRAFEWMARSRWERDIAIYLRYDPILNPLRSDPRFERLLLDMDQAWGWR